MAKKKGKNYHIGDYIISEMQSDYFPGQFHLLKKQKVGWDVVDEIFINHSGIFLMEFF